MKIVTAQDFNQIPYNVPDALTQNPDGTVGENSQFNNFIDWKVKHILIKLLGGSIYNGLLLGLDDLPDEYDEAAVTLTGVYVLFDGHVWRALVDVPVATPPSIADAVNWLMIVDNRWLRMVNGLSYTLDNSYYVWTGLKELLKPYIYSEWLKATFKDYTKIGIVIRNAENATVISPAAEIAESYNNFLALAGNTYTANSFFGYLVYAQLTLEDFNDLIIGWDAPHLYFRSHWRNSIAYTCIGKNKFNI